MNLFTPIEKLPRVGPQTQKKMQRLGIKTVRDLIFHFPNRYEDFSNITPISKAGVGETVCIKGKVLEIKTIRTWKRRMFITQAVIEDETGAIKVTWFNQPYLTKTLKKGEPVYLAGKITPGKGKNSSYLSNPVYEKMGPEAGLIHTGRLVPIYPETRGLSSRMLRWLLLPVLTELKKDTTETLPDNIISEFKLFPLGRSLWQIHFPDSIQMVERARERISFEELFYISLFVLRERRRLAKESAIPISMNLPLIQRFVKSLSFKLTDAQRKSAWQILKDIEKPRPMNRLLEGDVGSGKTVVAMMAALNAIKAGYQVAFMAPTEILAKQHFESVAKLLNPFNLDIGLLTGKEDKFKSKKLKNDVIEVSRMKLVDKSKKGEINLLIGTHALIQDTVKFKNLALVILDEQHRFGVEQRAKLCQQSKNTSRLIPHLLSMTATPIPRTLALTIYGDLDLSLIDELPKNRKKIITEIVDPKERKKAYDFAKQQVKTGRKIFVICPRIEEREITESEEALGLIEVKAVKKEYEKLSKEIFPDLKVGMLHGKMTTKEKERTMKTFRNDHARKERFDILVSTSVVEVGIDVPDATVMLIEGADRFGLAQLHQLRGRVGRSDYQSYCFLFTESPSKKTRQRLKALITAENGFELAEKDLAIRGPGEFSGTKQWGVPDIAMASLKDIALVEKTRNAAKELLEENPGLKKYPALLARLKEFNQRIHLE